MGIYDEDHQDYDKQTVIIWWNTDLVCQWNLNIDFLTRIQQEIVIAFAYDWF